MTVLVASQFRYETLLKVRHDRRHSMPLSAKDISIDMSPFIFVYSFYFSGKERINRCMSWTSDCLKTRLLVRYSFWICYSKRLMVSLNLYHVFVISVMVLVE